MASSRHLSNLVLAVVSIVAASAIVIGITYLWMPRSATPSAPGSEAANRVAHIDGFRRATSQGDDAALVARRTQLIPTVTTKLMRERPSRAQVLTYLGPPDRVNVTTGEIMYYLGPEDGYISIDSKWLTIRFDERQCVTDVRIRPD